MKKEKNDSKQVIASCFLAGCLEMYDFAMFGLLATTIHKNYFSFMDSGASLIITYALFAVGFICRPLGALVFGYIGDIYGRKIALVSSVSIMGCASLAMCLMPTYESIGIVSCYLIALARVIQGISLGGEFSGGVIYAIEHATTKRVGLVGSSVVAGSSSGILLATIVATVVTHQAVPDYTWRFAFLLGFGLSIIGYFIRQKLTETPEFMKAKKLKNKIPLMAGLKEYKLESLSTILIAAAGGSNLYLVVVFIPNYLSELTSLELSYLPTITTLVLVLLSSFWGWKSDKIGRGKLIAIGGVVNAVYALIMLPLIMLNPTVLNITMVIAMHAILFSVLNGTTNVFAVELFPAECRYSCYAFCHSIGMGVIGGTSPMVAALIIKHSNYPIFALGFYLFIITMTAGVVIVLTVKKQRRLYNLRALNINEKKGVFEEVGPRALCTKAIRG